ncbi:hypothetical protein QP248_08425 [Aerococcus sp. UMB8608]|uniref:hypothetical protein n=1 Tax=Aerococcus sp. UMB8608 TaxID=3046347 RepID=UPI0025504C2F|nr:hypothetical protein [Aerococcus sp. UMB8608]MDK6680467.1 hypothetical protein [Aerococcus sp. UMB8608]
MMKYKLSVANRDIREQAGYAQRGNSWRIILAYVIAVIILSAMGVVATMGLSYLSQAEAAGWLLGLLGVVFVLIYLYVIIQMMVFGFPWSFLEMVDTGNYRIKTIFRPFRRRPGRNVLAYIFFELLFALVSLLMSLVSGVLFGLTTYNLLPNEAWSFNVQMPDAAAGQELAQAFLAGDSRLLILAGISFAVSLVLTLLYLAFLYGFAFTPFLPYDSETASASALLGISRQMMRGNKFKLFRIHFFYMVVPYLLAFLFGLVLIATGLVFNLDGGLFGLLAGGIAFILIIVYVVFGLRAFTATAVFYRNYIKQYRLELNEAFPELNLTTWGQGSETEIYQQDQRPQVPEETMAFAVPDELKTKDSTTEDLSPSERAGAAAIFTAADSTLDDAPSRPSEEAEDVPDTPQVVDPQHDPELFDHMDQTFSDDIRGEEEQAEAIFDPDDQLTYDEKTQLRDNPTLYVDQSDESSPKD